MLPLLLFLRRSPLATTTLGLFRFLRPESDEKLKNKKTDITPSFRSFLHFSFHFVVDQERQCK